MKKAVVSLSYLMEVGGPGVVSVVKKVITLFLLSEMVAKTITLVALLFLTCWMLVTPTARCKLIFASF